MPYILKEFNGIILSAKNAESDLSVEASGNFISLSAGAFDSNGTEQTYHHGMELQKQFVIADDTTDLIATFRQLRALIGTRGNLWRQWADGTREWTTARLLSLSAKRGRENKNTQEIGLKFKILSPTWYGATIVTSTIDITGRPQTINLVNSGNADVSNITILITVPSNSASPITTLMIGISGLSEFIWTGSAAAGDSLVIDCGARSIRKNGINAYSLTFTANHLINEWLRLEPGTNAVQVTLNQDAILQDRAIGSWHGTRVVPTYPTALAVADKIDITFNYYDSWI